ncbi:hypothetical protein GCM10009854_17210 [Saccharopolyspora halophila]|uniref:Transposase n=1 Tax=Saccharopolyspora halophila TaxID=405551 RepID=A0ABN3G004_9PSEU
MDLAEIARELYTADPAGFVAARDRAAREADDDLARRIKKLRKPTLAAWAVNRLVASEPARFDELLDLGERLRAAQRELRGDELRDLAAERARLLRAVTDRAVELAAEGGHVLGEAARNQIEQTFTAALSDPDAAAAVRAATLAAPLEYSGFGLDELAAASIRRRSAGPKEGRSARPTKGSGDEPGGELVRLRNRLREKEDHVSEAEREVRGAEEEQHEAEQCAQRLREELADAQERLRTAGENLRAARHKHQRAVRARDTAARELDRERPPE